MDHNKVWNDWVIYFLIPFLLWETFAVVERKVGFVWCSISQISDLAQQINKREEKLKSYLILLLLQQEQGPSFPAFLCADIRVFPLTLRQHKTVTTKEAAPTTKTTVSSGLLLIALPAKNLLSLTTILYYIRLCPTSVLCVLCLCNDYISIITSIFKRFKCWGGGEGEKETHFQNLRIGF